MKHTPTPWKQLGNEIVGGSGTANGWVVFKLACGHTSNAPVHSYLTMECDPHDELVTANAEFACRAVNAHDELLAACKEAVVALERNGMGSFLSAIQARNAIAKASPPAITPEGNVNE